MKYVVKAITEGFVSVRFIEADGLKCKKCNTEKFLYCTSYLGIILSKGQHESLQTFATHIFDQRHTAHGRLSPQLPLPPMTHRTCSTERAGRGLSLSPAPRTAPHLGQKLLQPLHSHMTVFIEKHLSQFYLKLNIFKATYIPRT